MFYKFLPNVSLIFRGHGVRVSYDFQAKKGEAYWILLRYRGRKRGIRDSGSKKKFFDGREQNGEAQQKAMKLHQESLGRAETPEALDGFVIMREGDSSARRKRTSLYMRGKKIPPGDMENL